MDETRLRILESVKIWSGRGDLNARPPAPKAGALPGCATPRQKCSLDSSLLQALEPVPASRCYPRARRIKMKMRKPDIARRIARHSRVSQAEAADRLDRMIHL